MILLKIGLDFKGLDGPTGRLAFGRAYGIKTYKNIQKKKQTLIIDFWWFGDMIDLQNGFFFGGLIQLR